VFIHKIKEKTFSMEEKEMRRKKERK